MRNMIQFEKMVSILQDAVNQLSDPDRVKVVRCSDCRFWEPPTDIEADDGCTAGHCRNDYGACANQQTDMNWFCADGERNDA
jgi:hypothetical protein